MSFKNLFGVDESEIKPVALVTPILPKGFLESIGIGKLIPGKLYSTGSNSYFTLIYTRIGASLLGDSVLYLDKTACRNLILFGTCELVKRTERLNVGNLLCPTKALNCESFNQVLKKNFAYADFSFADETLLQDLINFSKNHNLEKVVCASFGSLKLEEENLDYLIANGIEAVDMECSAFFNAAKYIERKAIALLVATDIILEKPFDHALGQKEQSSIVFAIKQAAQILHEFGKNLS